VDLDAAHAHRALGGEQRHRVAVRDLSGPGGARDHGAEARAHEGAVDWQAEGALGAVLGALEARDDVDQLGLSAAGERGDGDHGRPFEEASLYDGGGVLHRELQELFVDEIRHGQHHGAALHA
jgi:hypothetical protein